MTVSGTGTGPAGPAWTAVRGSPLRLFASLWPLRTLAYVASGAAVGLITLPWLAVAFVLGAGAGTPLLTRPLVALERRRVALLGGPPLPDSHRRPDRPGLAALLRSRYAEALTWRELAYTVLHGTVLLVLDVVAIGIVFAPILVLGAFQMVSAGPAADAPGPAAQPGALAPTPQPDGLSSGWSTDGADVVVLVLVGVLAALVLLVVAFVAIVYAVPLAAVAHGEIARQLLSPGPEETVRTLSRSRARLVDAFEVERRRIERDLHDGAQQRLLELGMTLVTARLELDENPQATRTLLEHAAGQARSALAELRELIRGVHPRVLTDLGLPAAVAELADRSTVPVTVALDFPDRLPSTVESAAYFVVAEALTNAVKHANPTRISATGEVNANSLVVEVRDDGGGGADPANGTGLAGLADRVDALEGVLTICSPRGGPTSLRLDLPCSG